MDTPEKFISLLAYLQDMSRSLRSVRLVLHPEKLNLSEVSYAN